MAAIVARADRFVSASGGMQDLVTLEQLLHDAEVREWTKLMGASSS